MTATVATSTRTASFVRFPPRWRNILVPDAPRAATALGTTLYAASRPHSVLGHRLIWSATKVCGARAVRGPRTQWSPPTGHVVFDAMLAQWQAFARSSIEAYAVYLKLQPFRSGFAVLLYAGADSMFVRVSQDQHAFAVDRRIDEAHSRQGPRTFTIPPVLGSGDVDGWHWLAQAPMSRRPHAPDRRDIAGFFPQLSTVVEDALPRPVDVPAHWRGAHGDLTPWNVRRVGRRRVVIDWSDACWAPPGADELCLAVSTRAMASPPRAALDIRADQQEARDFWVEIVRERRVVDSERELRRRLLVLLGADP